MTTTELPHLSTRRTVMWFIAPHGRSVVVTAVLGVSGVAFRGVREQTTDHNISRKLLVFRNDISPIMYLSRHAACHNFHKAPTRITT